MTRIPSTRERPARPPARAPVRRLSGLEHLSRRGRISRSQRAAGEAYGSVWRRSQSEATLPSPLARAAEPFVQSRLPPDPGAGLSAAEARLRARRHLAGPVSYTHLTLPTNREV